METITLDLQTMFEKNEGYIIGGYIEKSIEGKTEYYDLYIDNTLVCMDGEECEIIEESHDTITLLNIEGETEQTFTLFKKDLI